MPGEVVQLHGKLRDESQAAEVKKVVEGVLGADPYCGEGQLSVSTSKMRLARESAVLANRFYALGLQLFWRGQYPEADKAFAQALAEAPAARFFNTGASSPPWLKIKKTAPKKNFCPSSRTIP